MAALVVLCALGVVGASAGAQPPGLILEDDFSGGPTRWQPYFEKGAWAVEDGCYRSSGDFAISARLARVQPVADAVIEADVRVAVTGRRNFGLVLRAHPDRSCAVIRHYDAKHRLELLRYRRAKLEQIPGSGPVDIQPGKWYRIKAAALEDMVFGKIWPAEAEEPAWQFRAVFDDRRPGSVGLVVEDGSRVEFKGVRIWSGPALDKLRETLSLEKEEYARRLRKGLTLEVEPTPFVLKTAGGPARRIAVRPVVAGKPEPVDGKLTASFGGSRREIDIKRSEFRDGQYPLLVPEPDRPTELSVTLAAAVGKRLQARCLVKPVRKWTFYMTPHTHYDIGFTAPQPVVIKRLADDLDTAQPFCDQTAGWPPESRFRWTVEVTGLVKDYADRRSEEKVAKLMEHTRDGRIEICGYYLNMPTEVVGHEEIIRCLYYAQELRRKYGVRIDTAMIDDVPGYAWALPELLAQAGIRRVSFRANSIRGQFLWYRLSAVPRAFYWEGPAGSRVFMWYTDTYRDGNFFRTPGLHEKQFLDVIHRNEAAGLPLDDIQLRMGGDNLPPDLDASKNTRAWNEKYLWPKVRMATNREFLEALEARYGARCETRRGDIPSWWADGPASAARENGMVRLLHDELVDTEALWTIAHLADPRIEYPRAEINAAYDKMIHFDEHTWGASCSISKPKSEETARQWKFKAAYAYDAKRLADGLRARVVKHLARQTPAPAEHSVAVWNTLAWPRSDVVELPLAATPLEGAPGITVTDTRNGKPVPVQRSPDGKRAWFVAQDVPALGCAVFSVEPVESAASAAEKPATGKPGTLENRWYRVVAAPDAGGLASWYDKELKRELLDPRATYRGNQPIYERSLDGRDAISAKRPTRFRRTVPEAGKLVSQTEGPVFQEMVVATSLPSLPTIREHVRLYKDLKMIDICNVVTKQEVFDPEGVYFAFPFNVPSPEIRFQIADATMRPGKDQLTYSCQDFYAIQHWADVSTKGYGIILAPLEAPLVLASGLNAYQWADRIHFDNGHLYSWIMNNYWICNFRAGQSGTMPFRYRLTSYAGKPDALAATRFAWQPFHPLLPIWLEPRAKGDRPPGEGLVTIQGDPLVVSCLKLAEAQDAIVLRLLEVRGRPARSTLRLTLPGGRRIARALRASCVEVPGDALPVTDNDVAVTLRANEIATIILVPQKP